MQVHRLYGDPQRVDCALELRRGLNLDLEVPEDCALDSEVPRVAVNRLRPHQEKDLGACTGECRCDQPTDTARSEDRVSHHRPGALDAGSSSIVCSNSARAGPVGGAGLLSSAIACARVISL